MGWYRRSSRLIYDAFRSFNSKIAVPRNHINESLSRTRFSTSCIRPSSWNSRICEFSQQLFRNSALQNWLQQSQCISPFLNGAKRTYYVDRNQIYHFEPSGCKRWSQYSPINVFIVVLVGSGVAITIYFGNLETLPYTKITHFVLLSRSLEKQLGESQFKKLKNEFKGRILPSLHPDSIRVQRISQDIIDAWKEDSRKKRCGVIYHTPPENVIQPSETNTHETVRALSDKIGEKEIWQSEHEWHKEDEILDDQRVQKSRKKGQEKGVKPEAGHLEGLKWELL